MRQTLSAADVDRFRNIIARCLGLHFDDAKLELLADVARRRLEISGQTPEMYLARLEKDYIDDEISALAEELTVPETYFFRHNDQFRAFAEIALPDRIDAQAATRRLRILSAACAVQRP